MVRERAILGHWSLLPSLRIVSVVLRLTGGVILNATRILWGQVLTVCLIALAFIRAATRWTAAELGYQAQLGQPWFMAVRHTYSFTPSERQRPSPLRRFRNARSYLFCPGTQSTSVAPFSLTQRAATKRKSERRLA